MESSRRPVSQKLLAPRLPSWYVARPVLNERLDEALARRLTLVVAGAGYGKTTQLAARAQADGWAWYTAHGDDESEAVLARGLAAAFHRAGGFPDGVLAGSGRRGDATAESLATSLVTLLDEAGGADVVLVVDDVHEIGVSTGGGALLESLVRFAPPRLHVVLGSRDEPPFKVSRLRGSGGVLDLTSRDLAFTRDEVESILSARVGQKAGGLADALLQSTAGWPAAVYLATEALRSANPDDGRKLVDSLLGRSDPLFSYLADEVIGREPASVVQLLAGLAELEHAPAALFKALGEQDAAEALAALARRGLVSELPGREAEYAQHALIRDFLRADQGLDADARRDLHERAAGWYAAAGRQAEALREATAAGAHALTATLLTDHAWLLNEDGQSDVVIDAARTLPTAFRAEASPAQVAHACFIRGDVELGAEWLSAWAARPDGLSAEERDWFAVQTAVAAEIQGRTKDALASLETCEQSSFVSSFTTYSLLNLGRTEEAETSAQRGLTLAREDGRKHLAEAHQALGEVDAARGRLASAEEHFEQALTISREVGNVLAECATTARLSGISLARGRAFDALAFGLAGLELADRIGFSLFQGLLRVRHGRVLFAVGRLDEAMDAFETAAASFEHLGSHAISEALIGVGEARLDRGEPAQARAAFERALSHAEDSGNVNEQLGARLGLGRLLADDDPAAAARLVSEAVAVGTPARARLDAPLLDGWIAVRLGELERAAALADTVVAEATAQDNPHALAEGLALRCFAHQDGLDSLREAAAIWARLGYSVSESRAVLALATLGDVVDADDLERAKITLSRQGVRVPGLGAGLSASIVLDRPPPLSIRTFGRFAVLRDGQEVPATAWQSRKARDLLKLLVCRRGSVAVRDVLIESLWPEEDPAKTRNRLSVALNVARGVLDPDGRYDVDHFIAADRDGVRLDLDHVAVDVEAFLLLARRAFEAVRGGDEAARSLLEAAEAAYGGEFLEEDAYADWADAFRDRTRSAYTDVLRALTRLERSTDVYHLRLLALDRFDEATHLDLIRLLSETGRHGEARRAYRRYATRMAEIGVEPEPFDALR